QCGDAGGDSFTFRLGEAAAAGHRFEGVDGAAGDVGVAVRPPRHRRARVAEPPATHPVSTTVRHGMHDTARGTHMETRPELLEVDSGQRMPLTTHLTVSVHGLRLRLLLGQAPDNNSEGLTVSSGARVAADHNSLVVIRPA